jgi:hypothetical protein
METATRRGHRPIVLTYRALHQATRWAVPLKYFRPRQAMGREFTFGLLRLTVIGEIPQISYDSSFRWCRVGRCVVSHAGLMPASSASFVPAAMTSCT